MGTVLKVAVSVRQHLVEAQLLVVVQRLVVVQDSVLLHLVAAINKVVLLVRVLEIAMPEILSEVEPILVVASAALVEEATVEAVSERKPSQVVDLVVSTPATTSKVTRSQAADFPVLDKNILPFTLSRLLT